MNDAWMEHAMECAEEFCENCRNAIDPERHCGRCDCCVQEAEDEEEP